MDNDKIKKIAVLGTFKAFKDFMNRTIEKENIITKKSYEFTTSENNYIHITTESDCKGRNFDDIKILYWGETDCMSTNRIKLLEEIHAKIYTSRRR